MSSYNFYEKQDLKALYDSDKLWGYCGELNLEMKLSDKPLLEYKTYVSKNKYNTLTDITKHYCIPIDENKDKLSQYSLYVSNICNKKYNEHQKQYLKVLKERETELIEFLNTLDEIKEFI